MNSEPSWDLYRTFHAVLREGSLSGAARRLDMSQPSIARHIDALETALGAKLFLRTPRGLSPTDAALELSPSNALDDLLQRKADVAVRMVRPEQQALVSRHVGALVIGLHAHRDYLARRGTPRTLADLKDHDLIGYDVETPAIRAAVQQYPALSRDAFALRVDSDVAQLAAIRAGFGIGICQTVVAARQPDLVRVLPDAFHMALETWIVMHEDLRGNARCRAVFDALVEGLSGIIESSAR